MVLLLKVVLPDRQEKESFTFYSIMFASQLALTAIARSGKVNQSCLELEGEEEQLRDFINWCNTRPNCLIIDGLTILADHVA